MTTPAATTPDESRPQPEQVKQFPLRRYIFATMLIWAMLWLSGVALLIGYRMATTALAGTDMGAGSVGTIALVVTPATTILATLSTVLVGLLRQD